MNHLNNAATCDLSPILTSNNITTKLVLLNFEMERPQRIVFDYMKY